MPSLKQILYSASALVAAVNGQGVIQFAQGEENSPKSLPLGIDLKTNDANIIKTEEIAGNVVNECGRSLLNGNIDSGETTELALIAKTITSVKKGSKVNVEINQVDDNGKGPYTCDIDLKSNANGATGQTKLEVKEEEPVNGIIKLELTMPADLKCIGCTLPFRLSSNCKRLI